MRGKYRTRTRVRGHLPSAVSWLAPKGATDCGAHEWYRADESTWRCYHCEAGEAHESPWTTAEEIKAHEAALVETLRFLNHLPLTTESVRQRVAVVEELSAAAESERRLIST